MKLSHFSWKELLFYIAIISGVVLEFKLVGAYAKNNIKAPPNFQGRYFLKSQNTSECFGDQSPVLELEQSGIYLFATLQTNPSSSTALSGKLQSSELLLEGTFNSSTDNCFHQPMTNIKIKAFSQENELKGYLFLGTEQIEFTAKKEPKQTESTAPE